MATPVSPTNGSERVASRYDHLNRRVMKRVDVLTGHTPPSGSPPMPGNPGEWVEVRSTAFVWDNDRIAAEVTSYTNGVVTTNAYFWGADMSGTVDGAAGVGGLLRASLNGSDVLYCYDAHGNVTELIDAHSGAVVARYRYGVFGGTVRAEGPLAAANPWRFATRYHDDETGLVMFPRRPYSPELGRFLSRDPIEENGGLNLYAITKNNPVSNVDPFGTEIYEGELFRLIVDSEPLYLDDTAFDRIEPSPGIIGLFYPDSSKRGNVDGNGKFWDWSGANCHARTDGRTAGLLVTEKATMYYIKKIRRRAKGYPYPVSGSIENHEETHYKNEISFWLAYESEVRSFQHQCVCPKCRAPIDQYLSYRYQMLFAQNYAQNYALDTNDYNAPNKAPQETENVAYYENRARNVKKRYPECF